MGDIMSQYLTKEEIKQWRSSLEKITLEEYARRLGKVLQEDKKTTDLIDIVMNNEKRLYSSREKSSPSSSVLRVAKAALDGNKDQFVESIKSKLTFKKQLTQREDTVLSYFIKNKGEIVYAKDLAAILDLPSDYVYKYIKNLRTKISDSILKNATKGGYIFDLN